MPSIRLKQPRTSSRTDARGIRPWPSARCARATGWLDGCRCHLGLGCQGRRVLARIARPLGLDTARAVAGCPHPRRGESRPLLAAQAVTVIDGLPVPEPLRQVPPGAAGPGPEEDPVDHHPVVQPPAAPRRIGAQKAPRPLPFLIRQIVAIQSIRHRTDLHQPGIKIHGTRPNADPGVKPDYRHSRSSVFVTISPLQCMRSPHGVGGGASSGRG